MNNIFYLIVLLLITENIKAATNDGFGQKDSIISLANVQESYKLSGKNLKALAEKILYKKTPQEDMVLFVLRPIT